MMMMMDAEERDEADDDTVVQVATAIDIHHRSYGCSPCRVIDNVVHNPTFAINELLLAERFLSIDIGRTNDTIVGRGIQEITSLPC